MSHAESCLGICVSQTFVGNVHVLRDAFGLANLITARKAAIEHLDDKCSKSISVDSRHWVAFNTVPACFGNFGWSISSGVGSETAVSLSSIISVYVIKGFIDDTYVNDSLILLHRA